MINPFIYGFMSKNFRLYFKTVLGQLLSSRLIFWGRRFGRDGSGTEAGVYGSTKSDASNRANGGGNHNRGAHFTVRMDRLQGNGNQRGKGAGSSNPAFADRFRKKTASSGRPSATPARKPSDPKTEMVSVNDIWPVAAAAAVEEKGGTGEGGQ